MPLVQENNMSKKTLINTMSKIWKNLRLIISSPFLFVFFVFWIKMGISWMLSWMLYEIVSGKDLTINN